MKETVTLIRCPMCKRISRFNIWVLKRDLVPVVKKKLRRLEKENLVHYEDILSPRCRVIK